MTVDPIPVLTHADVLVVEGTLAGCVAAHRLADEGRKAVLAASACSVPHEMGVCRRPWATDEEIDQLPAPFRDVLAESVSTRMADGEVLLNLTMLATRVEDVLLDASVKLFYGMTPCGVTRGSDGSLDTVLLGGKFGIQAIAADSVIDCTPTASVTAMADSTLVSRRPDSDPVSVAISAKVGVADEDDPVIGDRRQRNECPTTWPEETAIPVPGVDELVGGQIALHGPYAEFRLHLPLDVDEPFWFSQLSNAARSSLIEAGSRISEQRAEQGKAPLYFYRFSGGLLTEPIVRVRSVGTDDPSRPEGLENLWACSPAADVDDGEARRLCDPFGTAEFAQAIADRTILRRPRKGRQKTPVLSVSRTGERQSSSGALRFTAAPALHHSGECISITDPELPVLAECEVLVTGAGTSGVPAALAAAEFGAKTILIEGLSDLGGVRTIGGVGSYWFGRETPYQVACDDAYDRYSAQSGMAEEISMLQCLLDAGVTVLTHCPTVGVLREEDKIIGVIVVTDRGMGIVKANVTVDATGDGDLAAWAGAPFAHGNGRDAWTMWASFANFNQEKRTASRQYESAIQVDDPHEFTRTVVTGRRRQGMWGRFAHEMPQHYVAPRETRRIEGAASVTYGGILAGDTFPDVMTVCESNFDIKGIASSDLICCGVVWSWRTRTNWVAPVPYRAVLPRGVKNLLIGCRAYSVSHDALALARMQRDMVSLGASVGIAAARSARTGVPPDELDVKELQAAWVKHGTLSRRDLKRYGKESSPYREEEAERDVQRLLSGSGKWQTPLARLMRPKCSIGPLLRAFETVTNQSTKVKIARALCYLGNTDAVPFLLGMIEKQVERGLPRAYRPTLQYPPEHGWAPDPVYSLHAVGFAGCGRDAGPLMLKIASQIEDDAERFRTKKDSPFEYARAICAVAERNPVPEVLPALEALFQKACLGGQVVRYDDDMRLAGDTVLERLAYLELCVGRSLARCADRRGYDILLTYLDDVRGFLARSAEDELSDLLGEPPSRDKLGWQSLLEEKADDLGPMPFRKRIE